ncbi:hypothetical protein CN97_02835 [Haematobacter massiliensis]|uniref:Uncharacterized protein n=1 Tax=Haematobacter massiliensis TaxID=195105 RepID=A0A086XXA4_9RHOB|nr:hypothetical protein [Haematobacter massiliensis]KFI26654.1 hypothetical protein CN97_02835 [Haematobacter massiliensis]OWJ86330.1 hypothetical protein CDV51_10365 [Haematobacter massiliensis]
MTDLEKLLAEVTPGEWKIGRLESYEMDGTPFRRVYFESGEAHIRGADCDQNARLIAMAPTLARKVIAAEKLAEALRLHQAWSDSEDAGPDYGEQSRDTHPDGERIWKQWWDGNLSLCGRAQDMTRDALAAWEAEQ